MLSDLVLSSEHRTFPAGNRLLKLSVSRGAESGLFSAGILGGIRSIGIQALDVRLPETVECGHNTRSNETHETLRLSRP